VWEIREIRLDEVGTVTDLYMEMWGSLADRHADWAVGDRDPIHRWIARTTETDEAVCLAPEFDVEIAGYLLASVSRHPAMPGTTGELEGLYVRPRHDEDAVKRDLVEAGVAWARERNVGTIGLDAPWTSEELAFWTSLGFENDTTEVKRYYTDGCT
jgi:GNAT superfamily N-acetyltransferase